MAKGKPKAKFPEEYASDDEDAKATREARAKAPQAKPHKRGGAHHVKDEHMTHTKWDQMTREEMVAVAREEPRYIPFFAKFKAAKQKVKDLKKHILARTLADADNVLEKRAKKAKRENEKLKEKAKRKAEEDKEEKRADQQRKLENRLQKEEEGQILSDEYEDEVENGEPMLEFPQVYLQQEDSDISDTTSTDSAASPTYPPHLLRIFEWSFNDPPSDDYWRTPRTWPQNEELQPRQLPYTPMNVVTMQGQEMLHTPGIDAKNYGTEPDLVPALSEKVKECARNGVLVGSLEGAVVESGQYWSCRTIVQAWNGRMYFNLPRPDDNLTEVYRQWKSREMRRKRRMDRQPLYEAGVHKRDPRLKAIRTNEQRKITKKVYRASQWRPTLVYLPAYLPAYYQAPHDGPENNFADRDIKSLFYVRLEGESVPSFFFWVDQDDWKDPTKPNPDYKKYKDQHSGRDYSSQMKQQRQLSGLIRVKKVPAPSRFQSTRDLKLTTRYDIVLWAIERDLFHLGFDYTLKFYHDKWLDEGRDDAWDALTRILRNQLPPSGRLPTVPPVRLKPDPSMISIAEKMARVEDSNPNSDDPILPIYVNDGWTRNDDAYWNVEERPRTPAHDEMDVNMQYATPISRAGRPFSRSGTPATRPITPDTPRSLQRRISDVFAWVSTVSMPGSHFYNAPSPTAPEQLQEGRDLAFNIMVDRAPIYPFRHDMWTMMEDRYRFQSQIPDSCAICLQELGNIPLVEYEQHLIDHMVNIPFHCPFCSIHWESMDGETKAHHVRSHHNEAYETDAWQEYAEKDPGSARRYTQTPPELQGNVAVPRRKSSVVRFAQATVGQRTAYNDNDLAHPQGIYAPGSTFEKYPPGPNTAGSDATIPLEATRSSSPRKSQKSPKAATKVPAKSSIKKKKKKNPSNLTIYTGSDGRHKLDYDMSYRDYAHRAAYDPRRKSSSDSMMGTDRRMHLYTYVDNGEGWDTDSDSGGDGHSDSEDHYGGRADARPRRPAGGGKAGAGKVTSQSVVEVGSGHEEEEQEEQEEQDDSDDGDYEYEQEGSSDDDESEYDSDDGQDDSGHGGDSQNGKEVDGDNSGSSGGSGSSKNNDNGSEESEDSRLPSRKRPRRPSNTVVYTSSSGVTSYKRQKTGNEEPDSPPKAPTISPLTPHSSRKTSHTSSHGSAPGAPSSPLAFLQGGWEEWPEPQNLWEEFSVTEEQEERASDEDYEDEGLIMDEAHPLMNVKKAKCKHHIPLNQQRKPSHASNASPSSSDRPLVPARPSSCRSPAPSPSSSLARAEALRRTSNSSVPPNTPAVGNEEFEEGTLSQPPSPGQLSDQIKEKVSGDDDVDDDGLGEDDEEIELLNEEDWEDIEGLEEDDQETENDDEEDLDDIEEEEEGEEEVSGKENEDEDGEGDEEEEEEEEVVPAPRPALTKRQQAMEDAKKRKQEKKVVSSDESEDDNEDEDEDVVPAPKRKPSNRTAAQKPQENAPESEDGDPGELAQGEASASEDDDEDAAPPAAKKKQPAKQPARKAQPRKKRMTEAERLLAQQNDWKDWK